MADAIITKMTVKTYLSIFIVAKKRHEVRGLLLSLYLICAFQSREIVWWVLIIICMIRYKKETMMPSLGSGERLYQHQGVKAY